MFLYVYNIVFIALYRIIWYNPDMKRINADMKRIGVC